MEEVRAIRRYNSVNVLTPMIYALNLSGCRLLVFAYIQGFCKDENSACYSSFTRISETVGYARRSVEEAIKSLRKDGFIYKIGTSTIQGQKVNGYRTYFFELMDKFDAGEEIAPKRKPRKSAKNQSREISALPIFDGEGREISAHEVGKFLRKGREISAIDYNKDYINNNNNSHSARMRAWMTLSSVEKDSCGFDKNRMAELKKEKFQKESEAYAGEVGMPPGELRKFIRYWTEHTPGDDRLKAEFQVTFDIRDRMERWMENDMRPQGGGGRRAASRSADRVEKATEAFNKVDNWINEQFSNKTGDGTPDNQFQ